MSRITDKINEANKAGRVALVPFLPAGFPNLDRFWMELGELDAGGAAVIEIGMPFSDPVADGPVVEKASLQSLELGVNLQWIFQGLKKRSFSAGIVLMGYLNPILQYGVKRFAKDAADAGVSGIIVADLPFEESEDIRRTLDEKNVALIPLVGLNTSQERMALYAKDGKGFAYFVSVLGTTGQRESLPSEIKDRIRMAKETFDIPVALGFGLKHPDQLKELDGLVDAAVFGSALIKHIDNGGTGLEFMSRWR